MINDGDTADPVLKPRKPYQFTVRTFFAAAVWVGLLLAAVKTLEDEVLATAVLFLAWIALGELYRRFRAIGPLVALGGGPLFLLATWAIVVIATDSRSHGGELVPPAESWLAYALAWGLTVSLLVVIERGVDRWVVGRVCRAWNPPLGTLPGDPLPARRPGKWRSAAVLLLAHTLLALITLVMLANSRGPGSPESSRGFWGIVLLDLPVVPLYILMGCVAPLDYRAIAPASLVVGGALYVVVGVLVGYVLEWFQRKPRAESSPPSSSSEGP